MSASVVSIEERRAKPLAAVGKGYLVFRRHLLCEMSEECQSKIRDVYNETGFVNEDCYSFEIFGFYTDLPMAIETAQSCGGSWLEVPVNSSLPKELGRYRPQGAPGSKSEQWYAETSPGIEPVYKRDLVEFANIFSRCMSLAKST